MLDKDVYFDSQHIFERKNDHEKIIFMRIDLPIHKTGSTNQPVELDD